jgi:hypothetical protein
MRVYETLYDIRAVLSCGRYVRDLLVFISLLFVFVYLFDCFCFVFVFVFFFNSKSLVSVAYLSFGEDSGLGYCFTPIDTEIYHGRLVTLF